MNSINNPKIISLFMGGLILQLFNPILLANLVLTRLLNLFLFHYSNNISFIKSGFCGWLGSHILFIILTKLVSFHIECNSHIDYIILICYIHRTFSLLLISYCSFYLGRAPLLFLKSKKDDIGDKDDGSMVMARDEDDRYVNMARDEDGCSVTMHIVHCNHGNTSLHFHLTPIVMINGSSRRDIILYSQYFCHSIPCKDREPIVVLAVFTTRALREVRIGENSSWGGLPTYMISVVIRSALGYPTSIVGTITGTPKVCHSRSSRIRERSSQCSNACTRYGLNCLTTF
jgi:hypothetical protein